MDFRTRGIKISKSIIMIIYCICVFFAALFIISGIMNHGNTDLTTEMASPTFPVLSFEYNNYEFNTLYGYAEDMDEALIRDNITPLMDDRKISIKIDSYENEINKISYELRSTDGSRLIENGDIFNYLTNGNIITADISLKDLIYKDTEYSFCIIVETAIGQTIRYYTKIIDAEDLNVNEKLKFVYEFSDATYDKLAAEKMLPTYIESNSEGDNSSFNYVDIHSSLDQISWGSLKPEKLTEPIADIKFIDRESATISLNYFVKSSDEDTDTYYRVCEEFEISQGSERMFLMDYNRSLSELFSKDNSTFANNKIVLGITNDDVNMIESNDGNRIAFINEGRLYSYNITDNKIAYVFGFYESEEIDLRKLNNHFDIKVFSIDETGNIYFMVYGYMNRGTHEGEICSAVYYYDSVLNTVEEKLYIKTSQSFDFLKKNMERLSFVNGQNKCFLLYDDKLYRINLETEVDDLIAENINSENCVINKAGTMLCWVDESEESYGDRLVIYNMETEKQTYVNAEKGCKMKPIGFFEDDLIYGEINEEDIRTDIRGKKLLPMHKLIIRSSNTIIKEYEENGIYIVDYQVDNEIIKLTRANQINSDGSYNETSPDQILNNSNKTKGKNTIETVVTDRYETIVQIVLKKELDRKTLQVLTPKQLIFEKNKEIRIEETNDDKEVYYLYLNGEFVSSCQYLSDAVNEAYGNKGVVTDFTGRIVYIDKSKSSKNQIMDIKESSLNENDSLEASVAICLNQIMEYNGISVDCRNEINNGVEPKLILKENMQDSLILDLSGCPLDAILNYVDEDIPVMAYTDVNKAVLIVGYNEFNTILMDPETGTIYKYGINDSKDMFSNAGNRFLTYKKFID